MEFSTSGNVGNILSSVDNKGAMLDLLAAAAAVVSGEKSNKNEIVSDGKSTPNHKKKHRTRLRTMSVKQLQSLSANQLINLFALLEGDEMKKTFYYQCRFSPMCSKRFHSFGGEDRARLLIKDHLLEHVQNLKPDIEVDTPPKKQLKAASPKKQIVRVLKRVDKVKIVDTSVSDEPHSPEPLQVPSTPTTLPPFSAGAPSCDYDHDYNCGLSVPYFNNCDSAPSEAVIIDLKAGKKTVILRDPAANTRLNGASNVFDQEVIDDWLSVCQEEVVVSTEETPFFVKTEQDQQQPEGCNIAFIEMKQEYQEEDAGFNEEEVGYKEEEVEYNEEEVGYNEEVVGFNEEEVETSQVESAVAVLHTNKERKPKGKAKFIGQSDAEKQMAMQMIKAVRRKQMDSDKLECKICKPPRLFTAPTTLISHYRSHAGIKPYECPLCKSVFTRQHSLNYHILIHLNQTRFTCEVCGRKFRHPSHFKEHQRRHTGESPFQCDDCSLRFKTRNTYKRHLKTRHGKVLTQTGGITLLSEEEFKRVRTHPRQRQGGQGARESPPAVDLDKENSRRLQPPSPQPQSTKARLVLAVHTDEEPGHDDVIIDTSNAFTVSVPSNNDPLPPTITLLNYFPHKQQVS
ncbi:hypothetical protein LSTR_LSTR001960 [Laodelphax striatellus]|uniref:C2H2-type domain-containing protein n=1 Tax=Laodelphax striatellus TaxID=195883 RepID=A0A482XHK9_LAOST|nr:hypothetical protein LSTR_LSTR001960 [Laodelphax striatellus]